jgi:hypothetical protein
MNAIGASFLALCSLLMLTLPRRWAALPLVFCAAYMTEGQVLQIGPAHFTVARLVVAVGFLRVLLRRELLADGLHAVDRLLLLWAAILIGSSAFHTSDAWVFRAGVVWTELGCYFLFRIFLQDFEDVRDTFKFLCVALLPLAALMLLEKETRSNLFAVFGGVSPFAQVREGHVRAGGPFDHPILAGTVGAACIAIGLSVWRTSRLRGFAGCCAGTAMVYAATSSGPALMLAFILLARAAWVFRHHMRALRWATAGGLLSLAAVMNDPIYFLMARIDISGGSHGYFRAALIRSSINHLSEWWATGTDYTRHWMASGIHANARHTDIPNHLLAMGVSGGLPLLAVFVLILVLSFRDVGLALRQRSAAPESERLLVWMLGALLFGFLMDFWSISLYDQSVVFFYLTLAAIQAVMRQPRRASDERLAFATRPA